MSNKEQVLDKLLGTLWKRYIERVPYAKQYADMVTERGGKVQNDHIALRTFNAKTGTQPAGVQAFSRIFEPLGYTQKDRYDFASKHLTAWHYEHENPDKPKIFISQLEVAQCDANCAKVIKETVENAKDPLTAKHLELLSMLKQGQALSSRNVDMLAEDLANAFTRPWATPKRSAILEANKTSQYAAWTLLHGNAVNHFTAYINKQNVADWPDLETTAAALKEANIPMKEELEGEKGSKLRQTSTQAVIEECEVREEDGSFDKMKWSYAYYELAERGMVTDANGKQVLFTAFLGEQATNLFEMTKTAN